MKVFKRTKRTIEQNVMKANTIELDVMVLDCTVACSNHYYSEARYTIRWVRSMSDGQGERVISSKNIGTIKDSHAPTRKEHFCGQNMCV